MLTKRNYGKMSSSSFKRAGKKAQIGNYMAVIIFLMVFGFTSIFGYVLLEKYTEAYDDVGLYTGQVKETGDKFLATIKALDYLSVLFMVVLIIAIGITSYRVAASPVFFVVQFIMAMFYGLVSYFFNYIFQEMVSPAVFTAAKGFFSNTLIICTNLHWVMLGTFVVGTIALYAKKERGQFLA